MAPNLSLPLDLRKPIDKVNPPCYYQPVVTKSPYKESPMVAALAVVVGLVWAVGMLLVTEA